VGFTEEGFGGAVGGEKGLVSVIGMLLADLLEGRFRGGFGGAVVGCANGFVSTGGSEALSGLVDTRGLRGGFVGAEVVVRASVGLGVGSSTKGFESVVFGAGGGIELRGLGGGLGGGRISDEALVGCDRGGACGTGKTLFSGIEGRD
jgi:hypothetical protein